MSSRSLSAFSNRASLLWPGVLLCAAVAAGAWLTAQLEEQLFTYAVIEAVVLASIPRTARVNKKELKAPDVAYSGDPQYTAIDGANSVARAVNTDKDIVRVGDLYYMCYQAVWFVSKTANGPWEVATSIPSEVYSIPASSPAHHVTYVTVEDDDDEASSLGSVHREIESARFAKIDVG